MPYIPSNLRTRFAASLAALPADFSGSYPGDLAYLIAEILLRYVGPGAPYSGHALAVGVLEATKLEFYQRLVSRAEERARLRNGDLPGFVEEG